ncbi:hypothetical protein [Mesorhizobium amorphae]|uniref:hypothetical protein n=1 Tax=Mesorhizobium amorphae TaxID=71433 RepID=UPI001780CB4B|nr:hypothetical protein [Mesorhizobium amorphae]
MSLAAKHHSALDDMQDLICWTRMQSEAGQGLADIVARKEMERRAGNGVFLWGVGNAPAVSTSAYARLRVPVKVVFSIMKGRPRVADVAPRSLLVWRRYLDMYGVERELPPQALVTSRGVTEGGEKKRHYALMCRRATPLRIEQGVGFDPTAYRNVGANGGPVGASQVTALLQRVAPATSGDYEANLTAELICSYWVRLTDPFVLRAGEIARVEQSARVATTNEWIRMVADLRRGACEIERPALQQSFI